MELNTICCCKRELIRHGFEIKGAKRDGLLLRIRHAPSTSKPTPTRFTNSAFNSTGDVLACTNQSGDVVILNLRLEKFWTLGLVADSSAPLKFHPANETELLIGGEGFAKAVDVTNGAVVGVMQGHGGVVVEISFSGSGLVVTSSQREAIIWKAEPNYEKIRVLDIGKDAVLKFVVFMPISNNVLACFQSGAIQVWKGGTMEPLKQILPNAMNKISIRTIAFTSDGRLMILGGFSPQLVVFLLDTWTSSGQLSVPDQSRGVRQLSFADWQGNRVLVALTTNGAIVFYDLAKEEALNTLPPADVAKIALSPHAKQMSCVLGNGQILVYNFAQYLKKKDEGKEKVKGARKPLVLRKPEIGKVQEKMKSELDLGKLRGILREFWEYPERYRRTIWSKVLRIPGDAQQYRDLVKNVYESPFAKLEVAYPLHNKRHVRILKRTLADLVSWSPFFADVEYLPAFVFPFLTFLQTEPIVCFEIIMTIITNFCQFWFEYHPLPPVNVLGMIENVLLEQDSELLLHLQSNCVNSQLYAWPLLQTAFSEVLAANHFLPFWDHVITNEPSFLLLAAAAYNLVHRNTLVGLTEFDQFFQFYHQQNPMDFKRFVGKCYQLLETTSEKNHPRQYLEDFVGSAVYPKFRGFPRASEEFVEDVLALQEESCRNLKDGREFLRQKLEEIERLKIRKRENEEILRLTELRKIYQSRLNEERKYVIDQRNRLRSFRCKIQAQENQVLTAAREDLLVKRCGRAECGTVIGRRCDVRPKGGDVIGGAAEVEEELLDHYGKLLRHKMLIGRIADGEGNREELERELEAEYNKLANEIVKARATATSTKYLKQLNVATGLEAMDSLIKKVERELVESCNETCLDRKNQVRKLETESKELGKEIAKLMKLLDKVK